MAQLRAFIRKSYDIGGAIRVAWDDHGMMSFPIPNEELLRTAESSKSQGR